MTIKNFVIDTTSNGGRTEESNSVCNHMSDDKIG